MILLDSTTTATAATWAFTTAAELTTDMTTEFLTTEYLTTELTTTVEDESAGWPFPFIKLLIAAIAIPFIVVGVFFRDYCLDFNYAWNLCVSVCGFGTVRCYLCSYWYYKRLDGEIMLL